jgi:Uma2 family endonuclease
MSQTARKFYTVAEYLALEDAADYKSEYFQGEIFAMAGATYNHDVISLNLASALNIAFTNRECVAFTSDMKVKISANDFYTYPDVSAVCGQPVFDNGRTHIITNPIFIAEVLSDSTSRYDRGGKFALYRALDSLEDYVLIDQNRVLVEYYHRLNPAEWLLKTYNQLENVLDLQAVSVEISLRQIYNKVNFPKKQATAPVE